MIRNILRYIFGTANDRHLKSFEPIVAQINLLEGSFEKLSDEELKACTNNYRKRLKAGESLDSLLPEAFATVRESAKRTLGQRHYDVQLVGGIALHKGMVAEMKTGEGKTLVATLPAYLNALTGKGVHVVTVNDYLAMRDTEWMGKVYKFLGLTVGTIVHGKSDRERKAAYNSDITYGTNHEFGFDYLRDNMKHSLDQVIQRPFHYAIVDEVDSIFIDEARTPLVISGPSEDKSVLYTVADKLVKGLGSGDFEVDEKHRHVSLTDQGMNKIEAKLKDSRLIKQDSGLYDVSNIHVLHHINQALRAYHLFKNNVDYIVKDNEVMIIDEFTGRIMGGRRFSDGLHQALEAKEKAQIQSENQTLASTTYQNYFRLYPKLSGMTGTAATEADELKDIYNLDVLSIPTKNPMIRKDEDDTVFRTAQEKYNAIIDEIIKAHEKQQPILVGTVSIEKSELISELLTKKRIKHNVLNAKHHEREAYIIAQAGRPGAVTIATNMAGRGTDIMLGGNPDMLAKQADMTSKEVEKLNAQVKADKEMVINSGGLLIIGTERHESRRIDNQLRGRSGRMGDPGRSIFYLSLEDDLMRIFASERISKILSMLGMEEGDAIVHPMVSRTIEKAQNKVEVRNFETRKNLLKFDDVMNNQRKLIYEQRHEIMTTENIKHVIIEICKDLNADLVSKALDMENNQLDIDALSASLKYIYGQDFDIESNSKDQAATQDYLNKKVEAALLKKSSAFAEATADKREIGAEAFEHAAKRIFLLTLDQEWKDHLLSLDHLKHGIHLRSFGQKDPLNEYKREAFEYFERMLNTFKEQCAMLVMRMEVAPNKNQMEFDEHSININVGRNSMCPCGSKKKYKHCHGDLKQVEKLANEKS